MFRGGSNARRVESLTKLCVRDVRPRGTGYPHDKTSEASDRSSPRAPSGISLSDER